MEVIRRQVPFTRPAMRLRENLCASASLGGQGPTHLSSKIILLFLTSEPPLQNMLELAVDVSQTSGRCKCGQ